MKRYISSIIIFSILISSIYCSYIFSNNITNKIIYQLDLEIDDVKNNIQTDKSKLFGAKQMWDESKGIFFAIAPHDKVDNIDLEFNTCVALSDTTKSDEYYVSLYNLRSLLSIIQKLDKPTLSRIF